MATEIAYRAANCGTPLRVEPSRTPGRFHRAGGFPTQYACLHPLGPLAEVIRRQNLDADEAAELRMRIWALRIELDGLAEVDFSSAGQFGILPEALVSDDCCACRQLADRERSRGARGLIVPSAALPGTRNVVIFGERVAAGYLDTPIAVLDVPTSIVSDQGQPPRSLHPLVRRVGQTHAGLAAWESAAAFSFGEPDWSFPGT